MTRWLLLVAGAALLALAYPPFHLLVPSFVCLVPFLILLDRSADHPRPLRRAFATGFWFGLLGHGAVLYWIVFALWHFTPMAGLGFAATIAILALWMGVTAVSTQLARRAGIPLLVALPVFWTAVEWAIGHQGDIRFPWLGLGTSLTGFPMLVQIADTVGARGITFLLVLANVALYQGWQRRRSLDGARLILAVSAGVLLAAVYGGWRMRTLPVRPAGVVAVTQPNIGYQDKWDAQLQDSVFTAVLGASRQAIDSTPGDLIVWPEAAVPGYFHLRPHWEAAIGAQASRAGVPIVVGGLDFARTGPEPTDYDYWNAAFVFDPDGDRRDTAYYKRYLVPITERVPFVNPRWFNLDFFGGFAIGRETPVFESPVGRFGIMICYESVFPELSSTYRRAGADILLNITNDAWFGTSAAPHQHLAHLTMRAIETRAGIARAANTGISGYVDPFGYVSGRTELLERTTAAQTVMTTDVVPLAVRWGDWVGVLSVLGALGLLGFAWWRRR